MSEQDDSKRIGKVGIIGIVIVISFLLAAAILLSLGVSTGFISIHGLDSSGNVNDTVDNKSTTQSNFTVNQSVFEGFKYLKSSLRDEGINSAKFYVSPEKEYYVMSAEPRIKPRILFRTTSIHYAETYDKYNFSKPLVMKSSNAEGVISEAPIQNYNNGNLTKRAFKQSVSIRIR